MGCCQCTHHSWHCWQEQSLELFPAFFLGEEHENRDPAVSLREGREVSPCFGPWCTSPC